MNALWHAVACDLACFYFSLWPYLTQDIQGHSLSDIDWLFRLLIKELLSILSNNILHKKLLVIVIDALDECNGLQHNKSGREDLQSLLYILKCSI